MASAGYWDRLRHIDSCDANRCRLRSPRLLRWLPGKAADHKYAFCSNLGNLRTHRVQYLTVTVNATGAVVEVT